MSEGELQKRAQKIIHFDDYIGWKEKEAFKDIREKICANVEEAKKDCPFIDAEGRFEWTVKKQDYGAFITELAKWFLEWFGSPQNK